MGHSEGSNAVPPQGKCGSVLGEVGYLAVPVQVRDEYKRGFRTALLGYFAVIVLVITFSITWVHYHGQTVKILSPTTDPNAGGLFGGLFGNGVS
jgi:hypothetical protein